RAGGLPQFRAHVQVRVHARLQYRDAAEFRELARVRVVVEGARDEHVEAGVAGLAGGGDEVRPRHGAELRADEDRGALLGAGARAVVVGTLDVATFRADVVAGPRDQ